MKAKIRTIGAILRIALTDHQDMDLVMTSSGLAYRPLVLHVTYDARYGQGFTWTLYVRRIKKDGALADRRAAGNWDRYILESLAPGMATRMDKVATDSNPMAALERVMDRSATPDV